MATTNLRASMRESSQMGLAAARPKIAMHLILVSPRSARMILHDEAFPGQRPLRAWQVAYQKHLIEHGHLRAGTVISFGVVDGVRYLINGQHTCAALGQTTGGPIWLHIEEHHVNTLDEVAVLYETYDRNLARSWADLYQASPALTQRELSTKALNALGAIGTFFLWGFRNAPTRFTEHGRLALLKDARIRFALIEDWSREYAALSSSTVGAVRHGAWTYIQRAAVLSVALVTYRFQPEAAQRFWPAVAGDAGLMPGQPAHRLLRFLRETPTRRLAAASYTRVVATCWNAAFAQHELWRLSPLAPNQPILIAGTPHDGTVDKSYLRADGTVLQTPEPFEIAREPSGVPTL